MGQGSGKGTPAAADGSASAFTDLPTLMTPQGRELWQEIP